MTLPKFERLEDVNVREAFSHEALNFTPWLAENLDRLGDAVGFDLELVQKEAAVEGFSADIHARCPQDGTVVLIENQLACSDHSHLGQIMTYAAGLEAERIIWVATDFRDEHLAAIGWLNDHTPPEIEFYAVRLRVVRIGASPLAPYFEVVEQPNTWERETQESARVARSGGPLAENREAFWTEYARIFPDSERDQGGGKGSNRWRRVLGGRAVISYYLAKGRVGLFVRNDRASTSNEVDSLLKPHAETLRRTLGVEIGPWPNEGTFLGASIEGDYADEKAIKRLANWLHERVDAYEAAMNTIIGERP